MVRSRESGEEKEEREKGETMKEKRERGGGGNEGEEREKNKSGQGTREIVRRAGWTNIETTKRKKVMSAPKDANQIKKNSAT